MTKEYVPAHLRRLVRERARECCEYCHSQVRFAMSSFAIEHIVPQDQGGPTSQENLALSARDAITTNTTKPKNWIRLATSECLFIILDNSGGLSISPGIMTAP